MKPFAKRIGAPLTKEHIAILQINLGKKCNLACRHCHVEAGPARTEELTDEVLAGLIQLIGSFPQIQTVDLTGGAPEMCHGFRPLVLAARQSGKEVLVRSNLTIFFEEGYADLPSFLAKHQVKVVASLPCYLEANVDKQRGSGVFHQSIEALRWLNRLGYGTMLPLDLVYNPQMPTDRKGFRLPPDQTALEMDYRDYLGKNFGITFNKLLTITNLPIGRTKSYLKRKNLLESYTTFLHDHFNPATVPALMCRSELSLDYRGRVYDCDFNQMEDLPVLREDGSPMMIRDLLQSGSLEGFRTVRLASHCYGCTAGAGASCGGALCQPMPGMAFPSRWMEPADALPGSVGSGA